MGEEGGGGQMVGRNGCQTEKTLQPVKGKRKREILETTNDKTEKKEKKEGKKN